MFRVPPPTLTGDQLDAAVKTTRLATIRSKMEARILLVVRDALVIYGAKLEDEREYRFNSAHGHADEPPNATEHSECPPFDRQEVKLGQDGRAPDTNRGDGRHGVHGERLRSTPVPLVVSPGNASQAAEAVESCTAQVSILSLGSALHNPDHAGPSMSIDRGNKISVLPNLSPDVEADIMSQLKRHERALRLQAMEAMLE